VPSVTIQEYGTRFRMHFQQGHKTGAAGDHPVAAHCPETEYLNAVWACLW